MAGSTFEYLGHLVGGLLLLALVLDGGAACLHELGVEEAAGLDVPPLKLKLTLRITTFILTVNLNFAADFCICITDFFSFFCNLIGGGAESRLYVDV